ncbi:MAG: SLBB domain-containing protein [Elainella sp. Prado103]|nr:SLBB domain-containing protein [Elainella sp. Prado103]
MRVTTISTAALCSLGVLAAYGISNKVTSTPQPESPDQPPSVNPATAIPIAPIPVPQTIAPPEVIPAQPLTVTRDLAKERQQRESRLAQDLAKVARPNRPIGVQKPAQMREINVPPTSQLPIDQLVAKSVSVSTVAAIPALPAPTPPTPTPPTPTPPAPIQPAPVIAASVTPASTTPASVTPAPVITTIADQPAHSQQTENSPTQIAASHISTTISSRAETPESNSTVSVATKLQNTSSHTSSNSPAPVASTLSGASTTTTPIPAASNHPTLVHHSSNPNPTPDTLAHSPTNSQNLLTALPTPDIPQTASVAPASAPQPDSPVDPPPSPAPIATPPIATPPIATPPIAAAHASIPTAKLEAAAPTQPSRVRSVDSKRDRESPTQLVAQAPLEHQPITDSPATLMSTARSTSSLAAPIATTTVAATTVATTTVNRPTTSATQARITPPTVAVEPSSRPRVSAAIPVETSTGTPSGITVASVNETYTLGSGDRISLRFFNTPEYNGETQVQSDGTLNLPLIGSFSVAGMTLQQAEAAIATRYQSELQYPIVTVSLVQARPLQIAIVGEVQQPGSYTLALVEGAQFPSVVRAIQAAGGTTQAADLRNVQVQRVNASNATQTIAVNLVDLLQSGNLGQDLKLRDGDRIIIPTATTVDFAEATQFAAANFAAAPSQPFDVAIVGEVFRPGAYKIGGSGNRATVTQAIQLAGGVKPTANIRQIQIRRPTRTGTEQVINLDFGQLLQTGNLYQDVMLQQGDRIMIPTAPALTPEEVVLLANANVSPATIQVNIVGEVKSPGVVSVVPSSTLNQAILAAGGLNNRATRELELIRLEPNGTLTRRTINMDILQGFNTTENPLLQNNDIVVVGRSGLAQFSDQFGQINNVIAPLLQLIPFDPF